MQVRRLEAGDRDGWDAVWASYLDFYATSLPDEVSDLTFARMTGDDPRFVGFAALSGEAQFLGLAHVVVGPNTWSSTDDGYLEDLAVHPDHRGTGAGRALIAAITAHGLEAGWRRLHWLTEEHNERARHLYDRVGTLTDYVRYAIDL